MGRNEIKLRRQSMSSGRIARHRNYESLMARHERDQRIKRLSRLIVYVLIVIILICTFLALILIRQKSPIKVPGTNDEVRVHTSYFTPRTFNDMRS